MDRSRRRNARRLGVELLEVRTCLSITLQINYSLDSNNFFDTPAKRQLLQRAGETVAERFSDNLAAIIPGGGNSWTAVFDHPGTGVTQRVTDMTVPANTIVVYAGGRDLPGSTIGFGGPGGFSSAGSQSFLDTVKARGQFGALGSPESDFGPWGGAITFDTNTNWFFGETTNGLNSGMNDFFSVALHELTHLLGFGTAESFDSRVSNGRFNGPSANAAYDLGGSPPLAPFPDLSHWADGTRDGGFETAMSPVILQGTRKRLTTLDFAALADLGWTLANDSDAEIAGALNTGISGSGAFQHATAKLDTAVDVDLYKVTANSGQVLRAETSAKPGGVSVNTLIRVFNASGVEVAKSDNGGYDSLSFTIPTAGVYYVGVSGNSNFAYLATDQYNQSQASASGDYQLNVSLANQGEEPPTPPPPPPGTLSADLGVTVTPSAATVVAGTPLTYTITVTNFGPDRASTVTVRDVLPDTVTPVSFSTSQGSVSNAGTTYMAVLGSLEPGATATLTVVVTPTVAGALAHSASATAVESDPISANNQSSATVNVVLPDTTPPIISAIRVVTVGRTSAIVLTFSEALTESTAALAANYVLTNRARVPRRFAITQARYNSSARTVTLRAGARVSLTSGLRLLVNSAAPSGLTDLAGNALSLPSGAINVPRRASRS